MLSARYLLTEPSKLSTWPIPTNRLNKHGINHRSHCRSSKFPAKRVQQVVPVEFLSAGRTRNGQKKNEESLTRPRAGEITLACRGKTRRSSLWTIINTVDGYRVDESTPSYHRALFLFPLSLLLVSIFSRHLFPFRWDFSSNRDVLLSNVLVRFSHIQTWISSGTSDRLGNVQEFESFEMFRRHFHKFFPRRHYILSKRAKILKFRVKLSHIFENFTLSLSRMNNGAYVHRRFPPDVYANFTSLCSLS